MNKQIYLCLWVSIGLLTACGKTQPPPPPASPEVTNPSPILSPSVAVPAAPSPIASVPSPPTVASPTPVVPTPIATPTVTPTPKASPFKVTALPTSLYPVPSPVAIPTASPPPAKIAANPKPEPLTKAKVKIDPAQQTITPTGIGNAKIGMTFNELKQQMGKGFEYDVKNNFIEGFDAIAVTKAGKVQYYIPYPTGTNFTDSDRIEHLVTDNPNYRTPQGIGPGTSIVKAAKVYGDATLSMSKESESREFISFTQHPNGLAFRPKPIKTRNFVGDYPESNEEYLKTQKYYTKAAIGQITVSCAEDECNKE
jgi:hypothetical protein